MNLNEGDEMSEDRRANPITERHRRLAALDAGAEITSKRINWLQIIGGAILAIFIAGGLATAAVFSERQKAKDYTDAVAAPIRAEVSSVRDWQIAHGPQLDDVHEILLRQYGRPLRSQPSTITAASAPVSHE